MTAFQPDPDYETAFDSLGGQRHPMTAARAAALGEIGLRIESPSTAAREEASRYYRDEFGLAHDRDRPAEVSQIIKDIKRGLREKTLPGMEHDPALPPAETPEESGARLRAAVDASWEEFENTPSPQEEGRLF